jgi:NADH pyrophosphatase NudC (nudix superfamily)
MPIRSNSAFSPKFPTCSICNEFVELETKKVDEIGKPVHEECYVQKVRSKKTTNDDPLSRAMSAVLNSARSNSVSRFCPECGAQLEYRDCTVFSEGQTGEARLRICVKCDRISQVTSYHA